MVRIALCDDEVKILDEVVSYINKYEEKKSNQGLEVFSFDSVKSLVNALDDAKDGYLIVAESDKCPFWEKTKSPCNSGWTRDCFFCKYADFRTPEFIQQVEESKINGKLHSICHNEYNKKNEGETV